MGIIREPEGIDFVVIDKPMTKAELKEFSAFIKEYKRIHKMELQKNSPRPVKKKKKHSVAERHNEMVSEPKPAYAKRKPAKKNKKTKRYA